MDSRVWGFREREAMFKGLGSQGVILKLVNRALVRHGVEAFDARLMDDFRDSGGWHAFTRLARG